MTFVSMLRAQLRYSHGQRADVEDLERIVSYMRRRRERGLDPVPWRLFGTLRGWGRPDPSRLRARQAVGLRQTVEYVYRYVPFYREALDAAGVKPADIRSQADVHKLPITRREQLCENPEAFISRYPGMVPTTVASTSGTSGKPLKVYLTNEETRYWVASGAMRSLVDGRLGPSDIVQTHRPQNSASALLSAMMDRMTGALVLTVDEGNLSDHVESIFQERHIPGKKPKVSVLVTFPSHLWALTYRAEEMGFNFHDSGLKEIKVVAAMVSDDLKQRVLDTWGIRLDEAYGLTDTFTCAASQCSMSDRLHFPDATGYAEVLDPETAEPVAPGTPGVLAITSFYPHRQLMPLLRYWTDDLVILSPDPVCVCGTPTTQILDILGRADRTVIVGNEKFYPQNIGDSLLAFPELAVPPRFTLRTEEHMEAQYAILDVEVNGSLSEEEEQALRRRIAEGIILSRFWQVSVGSVKLVVNLRPPGSISQPFPYKYQEGGGPAPWVQPIANQQRPASSPSASHSENSLYPKGAAR